MNRWKRTVAILPIFLFCFCLIIPNAFAAFVTANDIKIGTYVCYTDSNGFTYNPSYRPVLKIEDSRRFSLTINTGSSMETCTGTWSFIGEAEGSAPYVFLDVTTAYWPDSRIYAFSPSVNGGLCKEDGYLGITPTGSEFRFEGSSGTSTGNTYGWKAENGNWYWYTSSQSYARNTWIQDQGVWYYLTDSGAMATGWLNLGGTWYYLDPGSGAMYANTYTPDGYYVNASGAWVQETYPSQDASSSYGRDGDLTGFTPKDWSWAVEGTEGYGQTYFTSGKYVRSDGKAVLYIESSSSYDYFSYQLYALAEGSKASDFWAPGKFGGAYGSSYDTAERYGNTAMNEDSSLSFTSSGMEITVASDWMDDLYIYMAAPDGVYTLVREKQ